MIDKFREIGIKLEYETVLSKLNSISIGRPHLASALVENGYVSSITEAFDKYLNNNSPIYIANKTYLLMHKIILSWWIPVLHIQYITTGYA